MLFKLSSSPLYSPLPFPSHLSLLTTLTPLTSSPQIPPNLFFQPLSSPPLTYRVSLSLCHHSEINDREQRFQTMKDILRRFPKENYEVFKYVISHLNK